VGLRVLPVLAPALRKGFGLGLLRETGHKVGVAGGDAFLGERLRHGGDELEQRQTGIDMTCTLAGLLDQCGNVIAGDVEQALKALRFFIGVHIHALAVLHLSLVLQKLSMTSTTMESCMSWNCYL
jgi:hypothetical protein